jgi:hypothetical protein
MLLFFYFYFQNTKLKQKKNNLKHTKQKIQQNIINASIDQEMERKKNRVFYTDNISALLSSAGLHLSVFSSLHKIESQEIAKTKT